MIEPITLAFLERIRADDDFRNQIVADAKSEIQLLSDISFQIDNVSRVHQIGINRALLRCQAALYGSDVVEALRIRLISTGDLYLSDGDTITTVRGVDPDLV